MSPIYGSNLQTGPYRSPERAKINTLSWTTAGNHMVLFACPGGTLVNGRASIIFPELMIDHLERIVVH